MKYSKSNYGKLANGTTIHKYRLENDNNMIVELMTYGASVTSIQLNSKELTLGFDTLEAWVANQIFAGATVGRYANRIANGQFEINGQTYELSKNEAPKTLHGGIQGFDKVVWGASVIEKTDRISVDFFRVSPDGEQGFPGNLNVHVIYTLTNDNEIGINYKATTDAPTHVNLSHHSYFNLSKKPTVLNHEIMIRADHFTPVNAESVPTGEIRPVLKTPLNFRQTASLREKIKANHEAGFDHNFVLNKVPGELSPAANVYAPDTGIEMRVLTTLPGLQFYTGNYIRDVKGRDGIIYQKHAGLCLEPQFFPDSPHQANFPASLLTPKDDYNQTIIYQFIQK